MELSNIQAIKKFFGEGKHGRAVENKELTAFAGDTISLRELGDLCRDALTVE